SEIYSLTRASEPHDTSRFAGYVIANRFWLTVCSDKWFGKRTLRFSECMPLLKVDSSNGRIVDQDSVVNLSAQTCRRPICAAGPDADRVPLFVGADQKLVVAQRAR